MERSTKTTQEDVSQPSGIGSAGGAAGSCETLQGGPTLKVLESLLKVSGTPSGASSSSRKAAGDSETGSNRRRSVSHHVGGGDIRPADDHEENPHQPPDPTSRRQRRKRTSRKEMRPTVPNVATRSSSGWEHSGRRDDIQPATVKRGGRDDRVLGPLTDARGKSEIKQN